MLGLTILGILPELPSLAHSTVRATRHSRRGVRVDPTSECSCTADVVPVCVYAFGSPRAAGPQPAQATPRAAASATQQLLNHGNSDPIERQPLRSRCAPRGMHTPQ